MTENTILIKPIVQSPKAISSEDGELVFNQVKPLLDEGKKVILDFHGIDLIVSTFLNASIGQLYGSYSTAFIRDHFSVVNMTNDDLHILKKVVERAKEYFADPQSFSRSIDKVLNNG